MMKAQPPPPLLGAGLPLPTFTGLPDRPLCGGATAGEPPVPALKAGAGLDAGAGPGGGAVVTGAGGGAGTDETCELCETWETWLPEPDT
jgi:hypothetical protein